MNQPKQKDAVAQFMADEVERSGRGLNEIAISAGFSNPAALVYICDGLTKLPINQVERIAAALGVDDGVLLALAMQTYMPQTWEVLRRVLKLHANPELT